jgi:hypothetical protein
MTSPLDESMWNDIPLLTSLRGMTFLAISEYPRALVLHASPPVRPPLFPLEKGSARYWIENNFIFFLQFQVGAILFGNVLSIPLVKRAAMSRAEGDAEAIPAFYGFYGSPLYR